jgi:DNA-binding MarR family transcriptional regulator
LSQQHDERFPVATGLIAVIAYEKLGLGRLHGFRGNLDPAGALHDRDGCFDTRDFIDPQESEGTTMFRTDAEPWTGGVATATAEPPAPTPAGTRADPVAGMQAPEMRALEAFVGRILAVAEESAGDGSYVAARRRILRDLERLGPQTAESLPRAWPVTAAQVARLLAELEEDGLVERRPGESARFRLTDSGVAALRGTQHVQADLISRLLVSVSRQDFGDAMSVFRTLRAALGR